MAGNESLKAVDVMWRERSDHILFELLANYLLQTRLIIL